MLIRVERPLNLDSEGLLVASRFGDRHAAGGTRGEAAGAPRDPAAGATMHARLRDRVELGQPLFTLHAESLGALQYALSFVRSQLPMVQVDAQP